MVGRLRDRVDEQREPRRDRDGAGDVRRGPLLRAALAHEPRREHEREHADRDVDEEDPLPAEVLRQDASERARRPRRPAPPSAPQIPSALLRSAPSSKVVMTIESAAGEMIAAPRPCSGARADQHALGGGETAEERGDGEDDDADQEDAAPAEEIGRAPAEEQEPAERDRVGGQDPLQVLAREVERLADRGERDVDDRDVEDRHEERGADHRERLPAKRIQLDGRTSREGCVHGRDPNQAVSVGAEAYSARNETGCAPCQRVRRPSSRRFPLPSTTVAKWLPASTPAFEANCAVAVREKQLRLAHAAGIEQQLARRGVGRRVLRADAQLSVTPRDPGRLAAPANVDHPLLERQDRPERGDRERRVGLLEAGAEGEAGGDDLEHGPDATARRPSLRSRPAPRRSSSSGSRAASSACRPRRP